MAILPYSHSMNIEHISVSRGKSYKQCPYYYKLKYHEKVPNPGEEQFYFVYGKIIHKIAECHVAEEGARTIKEISKDVLGGKIEIEPGKTAPALPSDYRTRLPGHLRALERLNAKIGCSGITEHKFRYDLETPNSKFVTGFIDRIILRDGKAWIIDYKTTKKGPFRENKQSVRHDPQLRMYSRVVQKEFGIEPENIRAALFYIEDEEVIDASYTEESLVAVERELLELYNSIKSHPPEEARGNVGNHCKRCEYRDMCPFFKSGQRKVFWDGDLSKL
jgi:CRISPR/Cas system-associated exonuclease Cas4 (RecB family)